MSSTTSTNPHKHPRSPSPPPSSNKKSKSSTPLFVIPPDIVARIAFYADDPTRARLLRTSTSNYNLVGPILYERITITRENAAKVFMGLPRDPAPLIAKRAYRNDQTVASLGLFWPKSSIESEDEDDEDYPPSTRSNPVYIVTQATCKRKIGLLTHVRIITIESIPSRRFSHDMKRWSSLSALHSRYIYTRLLSKATSLCYTANAFWQLLEWHDRHLDASIARPHPFIDAMEDNSAISHYCLTMPNLGENEFKTFSENRIPNANILTSNARTDLQQSIKDRFNQIPGNFEIMFKIVSTFCPNSVTIHNMYGMAIPRHSEKVKIFFKCNNDPKMKSKVIKPLSAIIDLATEVSGFRDYNRKNDVEVPVTKVWELISPPAQGRLESDEQTWFGLKDEVLKEHPAWEAEGAVMVDYKYAAPCRCCGTKEGK